MKKAITFIDDILPYWVGTFSGTLWVGVVLHDWYIGIGILFYCTIILCAVWFYAKPIKK
jgi:hypothetical protein